MGSGNRRKSEKSKSAISMKSSKNKNSGNNKKHNNSRSACSDNRTKIRNNSNIAFSKNSDKTNDSRKNKSGGCHSRSSKSLLVNSNNVLLSTVNI